MNVFSESDVLILQDNRKLWRWEVHGAAGKAQDTSQTHFTTPHECIEDLVAHGYLLTDIRRRDH